MRILLDTHLFLWSVMDDKKLTTAVRRQINKADEVFVSSVSIWEIAIKLKLGKIEVDINALVDAIVSSGYQELPVASHHAAYTAQLPLHHRDPFDRILVSQAICEPLRLFTVDSVLTQYSQLVELVK